MQGLLARGYQAWPLRKVIEYHRQRRPIPRNTFVVTFDDGYENVYHNAWPILREFGIPATIFVATAYLDSDAPFPNDDWAAAGSRRVPAASWRPLSTVQCAQMLEGGLIDLGTHTHTHVYFRGRPEAFRDDLLASLDVLRARFGLTDFTFAFPYGIGYHGRCGLAVDATIQNAGLLCSLTAESQLVSPTCDPFDWGRFAAEATDTAATLAAKLDGWYSVIRGMRCKPRKPPWVRCDFPVFGGQSAACPLAHDES